MTFNCPNPACNQAIEINEAEMAGVEFNCPRCGQLIEIERPAAEATRHAPPLSAQAAAQTSPTRRNTLGASEGKCLKCGPVTTPSHHADGHRHEALQKMPDTMLSVRDTLLLGLIGVFVAVVALLSAVACLLLKPAAPAAKTGHGEQAAITSLSSNSNQELREERGTPERTEPAAPAKQAERAAPDKAAGLSAYGYFIDEKEDRKVRLGIVLEIPSRLLNPSELQYAEITNKFKDFTNEPRERIRRFDPKLFTLILHDAQKIEGHYLIAISKNRKSRMSLSGSLITKGEFKPDAREKWLIGWDVSRADIERPFSVQFEQYPQVSVPFKVVEPPTEEETTLKTLEFPAPKFEMPKIELPKFEMPNITVPSFTQPGRPQSRNHRDPPAAKAVPPFDWNARYEYWRGVYAGKFKQPSPGTQMRVRMNSGTVMEGTLENVADTEVTLKMHNASVALRRDMISADSRALLFADDFATHMAQRNTAKEKREHESR